MKVFRLLYIIFFLIISSSYSQSKLNSFLKPSDTLHIPRRNAVIISEATIGGLTLIGLNQLWYKDYPKSKFHTINDTDEWLQMDKLGHVYSSYQLGRVGANLLNWSGVSEKDQLIYGATLGFTFLTFVELFDGYSEEWGFSWTDIFANALGTGLYVGQELLWDEQRITLKFSFHQTQYANQNPEKLGTDFSQQLLKDYNGQTYWLSFNINSFLKSTVLPDWLNFALGYGAEGMLTGNNTGVNNLITTQNPIRQYFISFDVDLTKIKTNSNVLRTIFDVLNVIKVPFPTLEFNERNGIKLHGIYF
jgi:uncharacterized protein YfiM (DUF2279 family)